MGRGRVRAGCGKQGGTGGKIGDTMKGRDRSGGKRAGLWGGGKVDQEAGSGARDGMWEEQGVKKRQRVGEWEDGQETECAKRRGKKQDGGVARRKG